MVAFTIDSSLDSYQANYPLLQMADKENQGLLHIEEVTLTVDDELERQPSETADFPDAIQLLAAIPKNLLRRFHWNSWHRIPPEVLRLLWTKQEKLTNIELLPCGEDLMDLFNQATSRTSWIYSSVTELRITDVLDGLIPYTAVSLLQALPTIDTLILEFWEMKLKLETDQDLDDDDDDLHEAFQKGLLRQLFAPPEELRPVEPIALVRLELHAVDLTKAHRYMLPALVLEALESLHVNSCPGADIFLSELSKLPQDRIPRLRRLKLYHEHTPFEYRYISQEPHTARTVRSLNELLLATKDTLQTLWIVIRGLHGHADPYGSLTPGVANHGGSLERLTMDIRGMSVEEKHQQRIYCRLTGNVVMQSTALHIPTLKTLNINNWPYPQSTPFDGTSRHGPYADIPYKVYFSKKIGNKHLPLSFYHSCLEMLAQRIARQRNRRVKKPGTDLEIVGFGIQESGHLFDRLAAQAQPVYFVRSLLSSLDDTSTIMRMCTLNKIMGSDKRELLDGVRDIDNVKKRKSLGWTR
ncbi:MAG: hypothetical protein Q9222_005175 [Ikaeria aurantiellina]